MTSSFPIIAIDGLSASGKGTIARRLADTLDYACLDTGLLYRAAGLLALQKSVKINNPKELEAFSRDLDTGALISRLTDPILRSDKVAQAASTVSVNPAIRAALLQFQRDFAANPPEGRKGAVLDGRDIGTVIAPHATVKIFVTADPEIRAKRRFLELQARGENVTETAVLADIRSRDERDQTRTTAPTKPAEDAVILDTSNLTADEAYEAALGIVKKRIG